MSKSAIVPIRRILTLLTFLMGFVLPFAAAAEARASQMRKKLRQPAKRPGLLSWGLLLFSVALGAPTGWAQYPSRPQVTKDGTVGVLQDHGSLPLSSTTTSSYPPAIDYSSQLGRCTSV